MKKVVSIALVLCLVLALVACGGGDNPPATTTQPPANTTTPPANTTSPSPPPANTEPPPVRKAGLVGMGLGNEFFQSLMDTFVSMFQNAGWEATAVSGDFDPGKQIEAIENFTAMGVDVIVIWPVAGPAIDDAAKRAMDAGIKIIQFVNVGQNWDVSMVSDDFRFTELMNMQAAQWVEETFPDAPDRSIECVAITYDANEVNKNQGAVTLEIEKYSSKIKLVHEFQVTGEATEDGVTAAENILTNFPNVNLIITPQGTVAVGVNNYLTSMSSPIKDYSKLGIFSCNAASMEAFTAIRDSAADATPMRGTITTGSVDSTIANMLDFAERLVSGEITEKYTSYSEYAILNYATIDEFLATGMTASFQQQDLINNATFIQYNK